MGRNAESNKIIRDERREQILSAALKLFAAKGLASTRASDIAAAIGISQGLVYRYFTSKEEIFTTLIREAFEKMNGACRMLEALPLTPKEKVCMAVEKLLEGLVESRDAAQYYLLIAQATASESIPQEAKEVLQTQNREPYEVMTRIFEAGQQTGDFKLDPPEVLAQVFWTTFTGLSIYKAVHAEHFQAPSPEILLRMFIVDVEKEKSNPRKRAKTRTRS
jgi:AcrR family transcriptional regulator